MRTEYGIIHNVMRQFPILYWPYNTNGNADYQLSRKVINNITGIMPDVVAEDLDITEILEKNPEATIYYPVFCESTGWWGELLGGKGVIVDKIIVSPECQLMVIATENSVKPHGKQQLFAAEIHPASGFFKKMNSSIATVSDMLATDAGTILALFSGKNPNQFINIIESTGNLYLGCIGQY